MAVIELRLTAANLDEALQPGDLILDGGEDLGRIVSRRVTWDGYANAKIVGELGADTLGLPSTVRVERATPSA